MDYIMSQRRSQKRPMESGGDSDADRRKKQLVAKLEGDVVVPRIHEFRILLPNGVSLGITICDPASLMTVDQFLGKVREEYGRETEVVKPMRGINWNYPDLHFIDASDKQLRDCIDFNQFPPNKRHILRVNDGTKAANMYKNMWDLTPDTDLLKELPEEYTFETALADLIDNSLQAVWSNDVKDGKLISIEVTNNKISIFDSGPGMDNTEENNIVKWGKMGASLHRSSRGKAIGGKPPYLVPVFGMFGYGGPIASMHLGRRAEVSSKTKKSKKVYLLQLERDALLSSSGSKQTWRTDGGLRDPSEDEISRFPHGSFTKVVIFEPKMRSLDISRLQCKLKDIYFPYIQCDELSNTGRTITPIKFQVNGTDLAEVDGGEVATTNLHSCNGPEFVLQLRFYFRQDSSTATSNPGARPSFDANARLKCVYFPVIQGKESIESILEKLEDQEYGITENYESFSRVSVRRLGRLLPDARWALLPFMDLRQRKGDRAQVFKKCCLRVKCFIDTDAGFNPTPSKTELAHQNPYRTVLKNFGNKQTLEKERDIQVEIKRDGKPLTLSQVDKQYQDWIVQMHERYDEEVDCGVDEPFIVVDSSNTKKLGIFKNVFRVHKVLRRRGTTWKSGQKIKVLKGACAGCHSQNLYATLEFFLLDGFQGDAGGEVRIICRPIDVLEENGCQLSTNGNPSLDLQKSLSLPIIAIDSGKCLVMDSAEWASLLEKKNQKSPSSIEILNSNHCQELGIDVALPVEDVIDAGHVPPDEVVAVVRPTSFVSGSASKNLDERYIVKQKFEMMLEVKFVPEDSSSQDECHKYSGRERPSSRSSFHGLYVFQLKCKSPPLFQKAGVYTFSFSLLESGCKNLVKKILVKGLSEVQRWGLIKKEQTSDICVRVGSCFPPFSIACYDKFDNRIKVGELPEIVVKVCSSSGTLAKRAETNVSFSSNKSALRVKDLFIESSQLDTIRPRYEATLMVCERRGLLFVDIPFKVHPGPLERVVLQPTDFENQLLPGRVIKELVLEMFDAYGNHLKKDDEIRLEVDGFCFEDKAAPVRKVDDQGCVDLSGLLKITKTYGKTASLSVLSGKKEVFRREFQIEKRELRVASKIPKKCAAGSQLENIVFEVIDSNGHVDDNIHDEEKYGQSHTLTVRSESMDVDDTIRYSFRHGRCTVRTISIPEVEGKVSFVALHSRHVELQLTIEVYVEAAPETEKQNTEPLFSNGNSLSFPDSPVFQTPRVEYVDGSQQFSDCKTPLLPDPSPTKNVETPIRLIMGDPKELEDVIEYGTSIGELEKKLQYLQIQQSEIEKDLSELQASVDLALCNTSGQIIGQEQTMERIEGKTECAAAAVCRMIRISRAENIAGFLDRVIGVVALLGTVQTIELSRILAEYLGDQMLAVVCKSYKDLQILERYEQDGSIKRDCGLHKLAPEIGVHINGRYHVLCLDNLRPYTEVQYNDPHRKLVLPDPTLSNGAKPVGYLGYAVNMITLPVDHLCTKTSTGHGLRETLFYRLFGKLQVYETRKDMEVAKPCIDEGAVSLDGAIMRGDGAFSLGQWEPDILFPVVIPENLMDPSPKSLLVLKQIEEKKLKLRETLAEKEKVTKYHKKLKKKFGKKTESYSKFLDTMENEANFNSPYFLSRSSRKSLSRQDFSRQIGSS